MGKLISSGISHSNQVNCVNCGMKEAESKGCCNEEQQFIKIDNKQKKVASFQIALFTPADPTNIFLELPPRYFSALLKKALLSDALLKDKNLPLFVLNCVFRI